ncbi:MAG: family 20 glycosylhydrolase [Melioribacteraceae bacterium]|nr:family 20 glycosylhydrolase [Melioribacteraceae bacterium]MCF8353612.1 family 20 glycosylhydrolase [Melioribacteraceae bacterium]MCF8393535.1 family 20 glycosylhydrolase [Melioribacteraceae bacterium]MCF8419345.1 family 20 glycosylhydrolase [Melioribacteraceae bacterium]
MKNISPHLKSILLFVFILFITPQSLLMQNKTGVNVIPKPTNITVKDGFYSLSESVKIYCENDPDINKTALLLRDKLKTSTGYDIEIISSAEPKDNGINLFLDESLNDLGKEGYRLKSTQSKIDLTAFTSTGLSRGIQTIRQLFPAEIESDEAVDNIKWEIPAVEIIDKPQFEWRGMLLDCCRHFMEPDFVKRYIDLLAYHKMNTLHWHLTEDQGWRIEIKKYPKLTEIGAFRTYENDSVYGGFYTQEQIRDIVKYAEERHIRIVPEIELPGHAVAALAAYPELSCTGGPFEVATTWGVFKDVYCAGKDSTFEFLQNVFDEVIELFPGPFIHIGGDEVPKDRWKECPDCQARIKNEGLKDENELQTYFIQRIQKYLEDHGRRIIGWDEILEGGIPKGAMVQSWRGVEGAIEAAHKKHYAIVSPTSHAYFNYDIGTIDLRKVYSFNPVPEILEDKFKMFILGGECNMWTEHAPQPTIDSKMFPRILAMSEALWTSEPDSDYNEFLNRVRNHYDKLKIQGVDFGPEAKPVSIIPAFDSNKNSFFVKLEAGEEDIDIYYATGGHEPDENSNKYSEPFEVDNTTVVKAKGYKLGAPYGDSVERELLLHKGAGKKVTLANQFSSHYNGGGENGLCNGILGGINFRDGWWQGFQFYDLDAVIDLEKHGQVKRIAVTCNQNMHSWIFMPQWVEFFISADGENWESVGKVINDISPRETEAVIKEFSVENLNAEARYIKVFAKNIETCPDWHPGAGGKAWIFADEIIIE